MPPLITALIVVAGLINLAPLVGVASAARQEAMYGVEVPGPNLAALLAFGA